MQSPCPLALPIFKIACEQRHISGVLSARMAFNEAGEKGFEIC